MEKCNRITTKNGHRTGVSGQKRFFRPENDKIYIIRKYNSLSNFNENKIMMREMRNKKIKRNLGNRLCNYPAI